MSVDVKGMVNDPQFGQLPLGEQKRALTMADPAFGQLGDADFIRAVQGIKAPQAVNQRPQGTGPAPTATIQAQQGGVGPWLQRLEGDIRYGTDSTLPGSLLKKIGAPGINKGISEQTANQIAGPLIGPVTAAQGITDIPKHPLSGVLKTLQGVGEATFQASGFIGPEAAGGLINKVPSKSYATKLFSQIAEDANGLPVKLARTEPALQRLKELVDAAGKMPTGMGKVFKRLADPEKGPMLYREARDIYSNVSKLSAKDIMSLSNPVKRQMGMVREAMKADIGDTAAQVGRAADYHAAMKNFAQAAKLREFAVNALKYVGIPFGSAAIARAGWDAASSAMSSK